METRINKLVVMSLTLMLLPTIAAGQHFVLKSEQSLLPGHENPVIRAMSELHPLGTRFAHRRADLDGDGLFDRLRLMNNRLTIAVESGYGYRLGSIKSKSRIEGFSIEDVDGDGVAEILVLTNQMKTVRAYDYHGNQLHDLKSLVMALSVRHNDQAIRRSLEYHHRTPVSIDGYVPPIAEEDRVGCTEQDHGNFVQWDGVSFDTNGRRVIQGTDEDDVISGTNGNDLIIGYDGDDIICGRGGHDAIYGGQYEFPPTYQSTGDNEIRGGTGNDVLVGGMGNDRLMGGSGHDSLFGGLHADVMYGDVVNGGVFPVSPSTTGTLTGSGVDYLVGMGTLTEESHEPYEDYDIYRSGGGNDFVNDVDYRLGWEWYHNSIFDLDGQTSSDTCSVFENYYWHHWYDDPAILQECGTIIRVDWP